MALIVIAVLFITEAASFKSEPISFEVTVRDFAVDDLTDAERDVKAEGEKGVARWRSIMELEGFLNVIVREK